MSIRNVSASRISPRKLSNRVNIPTSLRWERNKAWPTLTEPSSSEEKLVGLYAVFPGDGTGTGGNWFAVTFQGNYTVDFGDGTSVNTNSGATTYKSYDFNDVDLYDATVTFTDTGDLVTRNSHGYVDGDTVSFYRISSTTGISEGQTYYVISATTNTFQISTTFGGSAVALTTDGSASLLPYKIATVTITPQVGQNLTTVNLSTKHNETGLTNGYGTGWLDIALSAPNATIITISVTSNIKHSILERFNLIASGNFTTCLNWFYNCHRLREVIIPFDATSAVTSTSSMFRACYSLVSVPLFDTSLVTNMSNMFNGCNSLLSVPLFDTSSATSMASMFSSCNSLVSVPLFDTSAATNTSSMFSSCNSLISVPLFNTSLVTSMSTMFSSCNSLVSVPLFDTSAVTNTSSMFNGCSSLVSVPLFDTSLVTNMSSMFSSCNSLISVPLFNTSLVTSMSTMFSGCFSLVSVPLFDTSLVTAMASMFSSCTSLVSVPLFDTSLVQFASSMFQNCPSLNSIPAFDFSSVTSGNFNFTFSTSNSISRIEATGFNFSFSVSSCNLSSTALDEIYTNLPTVVGQTITVSGNYGVNGDDPTIATAKGWTVSG
jgi:surface protein